MKQEILMVNRLLIFGISGFVGPYLADEFSCHGYKVYGTDILISNRVPKFVQFIQCDIRNAIAVEQVIETIKPSHIVNLAAISSVSQSWLKPQCAVAINVEGSINILEAVRKIAPNTRILLIGTSEEYAPSDEPLTEDSPLDASNPYGVSKIMQERYANLYRTTYGIKVYYVRSFNHTGVGQSELFVIPDWCKQAVESRNNHNHRTISVGNIDVIRDISSVKDIVVAYRLVVESENYETVFNIGSGIGTRLSEILNIIIMCANNNIKYSIDSQRIRYGDVKTIVCDNSLIYNLLGWRPQHSLRDTISELINFYSGIYANNGHI